MLLYPIIVDAKVRYVLFDKIARTQYWGAPNSMKQTHLYTVVSELSLFEIGLLADSGDMNGETPKRNKWLRVSDITILEEMIEK